MAPITPNLYKKYRCGIMVMMIDAGYGKITGAFYKFAALTKWRIIK
jgi:hypothetical protein